MKPTLWIIIFSLFCSIVNADTLQPFNSDGCTLFPDGSFEEHKLWQSCCYEHDLSYWKGGTYQERLDADKTLQQCVSNKGMPKIALLMLVGVRIAGSPFVPVYFRWGYGWSYLRTYKKLTVLEQLQVEKLMPQH
jgi:hypothetical protein